MKNNRRDFLKKSSLAGLGLAGATVLNGFASEEKKGPWIAKSSIQTFNMSGYAAPKLETVRVGFIGLGQRGPSHLNAISKIEGTEIKALCDLRPESVNKAKKRLEATNHNPKLYSGTEDEWKKLCEQKDIDLIFYYKQYFNNKELSKIFNCSQSCIGRILKKQTYKEAL
jgi:hypothetical protein